MMVGAGCLRDPAAAGWTAPHSWTSEGVTVTGPFTGAHLLHAAVGGCVLNDAYREAEAMGVELRGVRVDVRGGFDPATWASTGVRYRVEVATDAEDEVVRRLLARVDEVAEIPQALRAGATVARDA